jgi:CubicO group peptidase (beta-lactamase class C family)
MLEEGVAQGVAPAMVLLLWRDGAPLAELAAGRAQPETVFDLASLTKPLATALLAVELGAAGVLPWELSLAELWGPAVPEDKAPVTVYQLLVHAAGFPAHRPYHTLLRRHPLPSRRGLLKAMLMNEPLEHPPGTRALYSDLGYMLLGLLLEEAAGQRLPAAVSRVYSRLGVEGPRYLPLGRPLPWPRERIAPCGSRPERPHIQGEVEDDNAHALGGAAGHAGLFGTARQVAAVMDALCRAAAGDGPWPRDWPARLLARDQATPGSSRTPGFDTPTGPRSAAGADPPPGVVGHLGFTGVSLWWHPASNRGVVLLGNRLAGGAGREEIRAFRHRLHGPCWRALGL